MRPSWLEGRAGGGTWLERKRYNRVGRCINKEMMGGETCGLGGGCRGRGGAVNWILNRSIYYCKIKMAGRRFH